MTDLIAFAIYIAASLVTMIFIALMQRLNVINKGGVFGTVCVGLVWWIAWPLFVWCLFYYKVLTPILLTIRGDI